MNEALIGRILVVSCVEEMRTLPSYLVAFARPSRWVEVRANDGWMSSDSVFVATGSVDMKQHDQCFFWYVITIDPG